jgi:hypothetical protein
MVSHHLHMVFPASLGIENEYLMEVEGGLGKIVKLQRSSKGNMGVIRP